MGTHLVVRVVAAAAELVAALGAGKVHAAAFGQRVLELTLRAGCKENTHWSDQKEKCFNWEHWKNKISPTSSGLAASLNILVNFK